jgi:hypothetical protein
MHSGSNNACYFEFEYIEQKCNVSLLVYYMYNVFSKDMKLKHDDIWYVLNR